MPDKSFRQNSRCNTPLNAEIKSFRNRNERRTDGSACHHCSYAGRRDWAPGGVFRFSSRSLLVAKQNKKNIWNLFKLTYYTACIFPGWKSWWAGVLWAPTAARRSAEWDPELAAGRPYTIAMRALYWKFQRVEKPTKQGHHKKRHTIQARYVTCKRNQPSKPPKTPRRIKNGGIPSQIKFLLGIIDPPCSYYSKISFHQQSFFQNYFSQPRPPKILTWKLLCHILVELIAKAILANESAGLGITYRSSMSNWPKKFDCGVNNRPIVWKSGESWH